MHPGSLRLLLFSCVWLCVMLLCVVVLVVVILLNLVLFVCCRYKSGSTVRSSTARSNGCAGGSSTAAAGGGVGAASGGAHYRLLVGARPSSCEVRRAYKAAVVPCKTGRRRARGMSMGQKVSTGVKVVNRDTAAPYKPVIPRELAQVSGHHCFFFLLLNVFGCLLTHGACRILRDPPDSTCCWICHQRYARPS